MVLPAMQKGQGHTAQILSPHLPLPKVLWLTRIQENRATADLGHPDLMCRAGLWGPGPLSPLLEDEKGRGGSLDRGKVTGGIRASPQGPQAAYPLPSSPASTRLALSRFPLVVSKAVAYLGGIPPACLRALQLSLHFRGWTIGGLSTFAKVCIIQTSFFFLLAISTETRAHNFFQKTFSWGSCTCQVWVSVGTSAAMFL